MLTIDPLDNRQAEDTPSNWKYTTDGNGMSGDGNPRPAGYSGTPTDLNLPQSGTVVKLTASVKGQLDLRYQIGANKNFKVIEAKQGEATGKYLIETTPASKDTYDNNITMQPGYDYYIYGEGTKVTFVQFKFTPYTTSESLVSSLENLNAGDTVTLKAVPTTEGDEVEFTSTPDNIQITPVQDRDNYYTFEMPASAVTINAAFAAPAGEATAEPTAPATAEPSAEPTAPATAEPSAEPTATPAPTATAPATAEPTATPVPTATAVAVASVALDDGEAQNYESFAAAVTAANTATNSAEITLLENAEITSQANFTKDVTIKAAKEGIVLSTNIIASSTPSILVANGANVNVTLDGTDYTFTFAGNPESTYASTPIEASGGTITLKNITVKDIATSDRSAVCSKQNGTLVIDGVAFENCTSTHASAASVVFSGKNLTIMGNNTFDDNCQEANIYAEVGGGKAVKAENVTNTTPINFEKNSKGAFTNVIQYVSGDSLDGKFTLFDDDGFELSVNESGGLDVVAETSSVAPLTSATVSGIAQEGQQLSVAVDPIPEDGQVTYQWYRASSNDLTAENIATSATVIDSATNNTYTLTADDIGSYVYAAVTGDGTNYSGTVIDSTGMAVVSEAYNVVGVAYDVEDLGLSTNDSTVFTLSDQEGYEALGAPFGSVDSLTLYNYKKVALNANASGSVTFSISEPGTYTFSMMALEYNNRYPSVTLDNAETPFIDGGSVTGLPAYGQAYDRNWTILSGQIELTAGEHTISWEPNATNGRIQGLLGVVLNANE